MWDRLSLEEIMLFSDEEVESYIKEAVYFLNKTYYDSSLLSNEDTVNYRKGFLNDRVLICPCVSCYIGYTMKDVDYVLIINNLKNKYQVLNELDFFVHVVDAINDFFGPEEIEDSKTRIDLILEKSIDLKPDSCGYTSSNLDQLFRKVSINIFKDAGAAKCLERSALFQNLLSLLGYEAYIVLSNIKTEDGKEMHAFNLFKKDNKYYYADASICNVYLDDDHYNEYCNVKEISIDEFNMILNGTGTVDFDVDYGNEKKLVTIGTKVKKKTLKTKKIRHL